MSFITNILFNMFGFGESLVSKLLGSLTRRAVKWVITILGMLKLSPQLLESFEGNLMAISVVVVAELTSLVMSALEKTKR